MTVYRAVALDDQGQLQPIPAALPAPVVARPAPEGWGISIARLIEDDVAASRPVQAPAAGQQRDRRHTARLALNAMALTSAGAKTGAAGRNA